MKQMSLKSVCEDYGLSRRAIQGYEKEGLIAPTAKTSRGYLLYDEKMIHKILWIKYFQNIGYSLKEIHTFIDASNVLLQEKIEYKIRNLERNMKEMEQLILDSQRIIELLKYENSEEQIFEITKKENK